MTKNSYQMLTGRGMMYDVKKDERQLHLSHRTGVVDVDDAIDKKRKRPLKIRANWYGGASKNRPT